MWGSLRDVHERASGGRYGLAIFKVERKLSFEDVERLVVFRLDVERRGHPSGSHLLDECVLAAGLFSGGFKGCESSEKPERLSVLRAKGVRGGASVHRQPPSL